jgi:acetyl esterase/lipase
MPSVTPLVRAGYTVWCMNYPLSPDSVFPEAVLSVLRCLQWLLREHKISTVTLVGDSAGGNLASMAAALATNPALRARLNNDNAAEFAGVFPEVNGVVSMYGLLDRTSFLEKETEGISRLELALSRFALSFIFEAYTGREDFDEAVPDESKGELGGRSTVCDVVDVLETYPRTFLVVGTRDVLVHSSRKCHALLTQRGFKSELHEYDARHAFIGLPPALNIGGTWRHHSKPATEKIIKFLDELNWNESIKEGDELDWK